MCFELYQIRVNYFGKIYPFCAIYWYFFLYVGKLYQFVFTGFGCYRLMGNPQHLGGRIETATLFERIRNDLLLILFPGQNGCASREILDLTNRHPYRTKLEHPAIENRLIAIL